MKRGVYNAGGEGVIRRVVRWRGASRDAEYVRGVPRLLQQPLNRGDLQQAFESELAKLRG